MFNSRKKPRESSLWARTWGRLTACMPTARQLESLRRWMGRGLLLGLVAAAIWGSLEIRRRVREDERFHVDRWSIEVGDLPPWVTPEIRGVLESIPLVSPSERLSLFERGVLNRLKSAMESSPWVGRVIGIGLKYPTFTRGGVFDLELDLRRPVALVEQGGLYYLADAEGLRLGEPYGEPPTAWFGVPAIIGIQSPGPLPRSGERWQSRDVHQGLEVAKALAVGGIHREFPERPVQAIDLTNLHGRVNPRESEILLWVGQQRLAWGRSPISAGARTVPLETLLANLRFVLSHPELCEQYAVIYLHRSNITGVRG